MFYSIFSMVVLFGANFIFLALISGFSFVGMVLFGGGAASIIMTFLFAKSFLPQMSDDDNVSILIVRSEKERAESRRSLERGALLSVLGGFILGILSLYMGLKSESLFLTIPLSSSGIWVIVSMTILGHSIHRLASKA